MNFMMSGQGKVAVVALLVVGPDRLPETIRTLSLWLGRFRRSFANIKAEIENEIGADEIRAQLYNESILQDIKESKETLEEVKKEVTEAIAHVDTTVSDLKSDTTAAIENHKPKDQSDEKTRNSSA